MFSCRLFEEKNKIIVMENGKQVLDLLVDINGNEAIFEIIKISDEKKKVLNNSENFVENYFNFLYSVVTIVKNEMNENGLCIDKVKLKDLHEIKKLDDTLEIFLEKKGPVTGKR